MSSLGLGVLETLAKICENSISFYSLPSHEKQDRAVSLQEQGIIPLSSLGAIEKDDVFLFDANYWSQCVSMYIFREKFI